MQTGSGPTGATDPTDVAARRFGAAVIDVGAISVVTALLWYLLSHDFTRYDRATDTIQRGREVDATGVVVLTLVWLAYNVGVFVLQRGVSGYTPGTLAFGLATVGEDGRPLGPVRALIRSVAGIVDYVPCCVPVIGLVTTVSTPGHRRVGDMAASSYVVDRGWVGHELGAPTPWGPAAVARSSPAAEAESAPAPAPFPATAPERPPTLPPDSPPVAWTPPAWPSVGAAGPVDDVWTGGAPTPPPDHPPTDRPWWDPERRAYLQWDPARGEWLQYDDRSQQWLRYDPASGRWGPVSA